MILVNLLLDKGHYISVDYCASNGGEASQNAAITVLNRNIGKKQIKFGDFNGK